MESAQAFKCYFCNKNIENDRIGHTSVCGNVLVPCVYKCGAYIQRKEQLKHSKECVNNQTNRRSSSRESSSSNSLDRRSNMTLDGSSNNIHFTEEMNNISRRLSNLQQNYAQGSLDNSKLEPIVQQLNGLKNVQLLQKSEFDKIFTQNEILKEWKKSVDVQLDNLKQQLTVTQKLQTDSDVTKKVDNQFQFLDKLQMDISFIYDTFFKEQAMNRGINEDVFKQINQIKDVQIEDNAAVSALWSEQKIAIAAIQNQLENCTKSLDEQKAKQVNTTFDVRAISQIASEAAEKIEMQEKQFNTMNRKLNQLQIDFELLEAFASRSQNVASSGKILWKINQVQDKLQKAKETDNVLKSAIFYTDEYGYKIRVILHLNGLKKWKDRYALFSIHVLKGDYDLLLKWPCHIEGNISLKDLENLETPKPFTKYIVAKRRSGDEETEEPQESSSSYIFIPHSTLFKEKYYKEDSLFIEIAIKNPKMETSL